MVRNTRRAFVIDSLSLAGCAALTPGVLGATLAERAVSSRRGGPPDEHTAAFLRAVIEGDLATVQTMLERDATLIDARDAIDRSGFALALLHGHRPIGALLREKGFELDLHESALALDWDRFNELASANPGRVNESHPIGGTAMNAAALGGAGSNMWRVYAQLGVPNPSRPYAATASPVRSALDHPDLVTAELSAALLLGNGANPNLPEPDGSSSLHAAAARGSLELVEMLIRKGANVQARNAAGQTPEDLAERAQHATTVAMLRTHNEIPRDHASSRRAFDVDGKPCPEPNWDGLPLRQRADVVGSSHGNLDAVRAALQADARLARSIATTTEGAVEAGAHMGNHAIVDLLLQHGAPYSMPTAVMKGDSTHVKALLAEDPLRIHERGAHDFALLWYPVIGGGHLELMELLLDAGADIERQHHLGKTALHMAAQSGQLDLAALLIDRGANINRLGRQFGGEPETPLQMAERRGHEKVVALLRDRGGNG